MHWFLKAQKIKYWTIFKYFNRKKSCRLDSITELFLKQWSLTLASPADNHISAFYRGGAFLSCGKFAMVKSIPKKVILIALKSIGQYQYLTFLFSKIMESMINNQFVQYIVISDNRRSGDLLALRSERGNRSVYPTIW